MLAKKVTLFDSHFRLEDEGELHPASNAFNYIKIYIAFIVSN